MKRIEQNDPSIQYTGQWFTVPQALSSGGSAIESNSDCAGGGVAPTGCPFAAATLTFTGKGITWIGVRDSCNGLALVTLDGTQTTVDTYGSITTYQQPLFTASGLGGGKHTITIQVLHQRDGLVTCSSGAWVWIDAFDIDNGNTTKQQTLAGPGLIQQDDPALTYEGNWFPLFGGVYSGGSAVESTDPASSVSLTFAGSSIQWIGYQDSGSGIANVYIDGALVATVDTYSPTIQAQSVIYTASNLKKNTPHTLTIEVTDTKRAASTAAWVWVDAFNITN